MEKPPEGELGSRIAAGMGRNVGRMEGITVGEIYSGGVNFLQPEI
jgi:hypothetical protein